jgi:PAS domain S-box-containing protein
LCVIKSAIPVIFGLRKAKREFTVETLVDEKFGFAVEACPNAMVMTDSGGRIILANTEAEQMFCYGRGELTGKSMEILVPEHLHAKYLENRASVARHQPQADDHQNARAAKPGGDLRAFTKHGGCGAPVPRAPLPCRTRSNCE